MLLRFIPTRIHGIMDYIFSAVVIALPRLLSFEQSSPEMWTCVGCGLAVLGFSVLTNYELGVAKWFNLETHLLLDRLIGVILIASPWLFGFAGRVWLPFVILGALALIVPSLTNTTRTEIEPERVQEPRTGRAMYTRAEEEADEDGYEQFKHRKEAERES